MREENRTDLPHDQVAQDNDGSMSAENNDFLDPERRNTMAVVDEDLEEIITPDEFSEETAAEVAPDIRRVNSPRDRDDAVNDDQIKNIETMEEEETGNTTLGWTALVLSIISLFFFPILSASVGIITGFFAYRNGARTLGMWAIAIGIFSLVLSLIIAPFVR